jgi:hypothetical protein
VEETIVELRERLAKDAERYLETFEKRFDAKAKEGRKLADDVRKDERVSKVLDQADNARSQLRGAFTSVTKTADVAVEIGSEQADRVTSQAKATATTAQKAVDDQPSQGPRRGHREGPTARKGVDATLSQAKGTVTAAKCMRPRRRRGHRAAGQHRQEPGQGRRHLGPEDRWGCGRRRHRHRVTPRQAAAGDRRCDARPRGPSRCRPAGAGLAMSGRRCRQQRPGRRTLDAPARPRGTDVSLHDRIEADLHAAMKARDKPRTSALRMVVAALKNRAVADGLGPQGRLDDEVVQQVLTTEVKRRKEAASAFATPAAARSPPRRAAEAASTRPTCPPSSTTRSSTRSSTGSSPSSAPRGRRRWARS